VGRGALEPEVARAQVEQHVEPRDEVGGDALRRDRLLGCAAASRATSSPPPAAGGAEQLRDAREREARELGDVEPGEGHRERSRRSRFPRQSGHGVLTRLARHALADHRALVVANACST
jgi:hypothetical protein